MESLRKGDCWRLSDGVKETLHELKSVVINLPFYLTTTPDFDQFCDLEVNQYFQEILFLLK